MFDRVMNTHLASLPLTSGKFKGSSPNLAWKLSEIKRINLLLFPMKTLENITFSNAFRGNRSVLIQLNSFEFQAKSGHDLCNGFLNSLFYPICFQTFISVSWKNKAQLFCPKDCTRRLTRWICCWLWNCCQILLKI